VGDIPPQYKSVGARYPSRLFNRRGKPRR